MQPSAEQVVDGLRTAGRVRERGTAPQPSGSAPAPSGVVDIRVGDDETRLWPFTTERFPARRQDPINLVFVGRADPRNLRAALLGLDGVRPDLRGLPLYGARWKDAIGGHQATYTGAEGWTGSVVQLECGEYQGLRVHLRIFPAGRSSVANAHLDGLIPGTADHQVLAWELARQLVVYDLHRSGLLDADRPVDEIIGLHPREFRSIPAPLLATLPRPLSAMLVEGGSIAPDGTLLTSGSATVLRLAREAAAPAPTTQQELRVRYDRVVPKPFCNAGDEYVALEGLVTLQQRVRTQGDGALRSVVRAAGELRVTPVDPSTGVPLAPPSRAQVEERHGAVVGDARHLVTMWQLRRLTAGPLAGQCATLDMRIGPSGRVYYAPTERRGL